MSIHVICPGCLKRFQVGARFAGMQGPCPNCSTIIAIPKETVKIRDADDTGLKSGGKGRTTSLPASRHRAARQPISRLDSEFDPVQTTYYSLAVLGVLLLASLLGWIPMYAALRSFVGVLGLCLIALPLTVFGYHALRDMDQMFSFTGVELYRRAGIAAAGYIIFWLALEGFLAATRADILVSWLYFAVFAALATLLTHPLLGLKMRDAFLHYCIFGFSVILLRFLIGLDWFWKSSEFIRHSTAPPPPLLPGM
jgi:hypothetical protein